jgi:uncharacterized protein (TIGR02444 family)
MPEPDPGAQLWAFALDLYRRPGVGPACLELQDQHGLDVDIALWCCWVGWSGRGRLSPAEIAHADTAVAPWRARAVQALRAIRRDLKGWDVPGADALRERVKTVELEAERIELHLLAGLAPRATGGASNEQDARANLLAYAGAADNAAGRILAALAG